MKIKLFLRLLGAVVIIAAVIFTVCSLKEKKEVFSNYKNCSVIIDAGHGGPDSGAVANDGTEEKDINLEIAKQLKAYFEIAGIPVYMTREDDLVNINWDNFNKAEDMNKRLEFMNSFNNGVVISIHQNKYEDASCCGTQVFYSENIPHSRNLANFVQNSIVSSLQPQNQRATQGGNNNSCVLSMAKNPAIIVECGFMSNYEELALLKNDEYKKRMAFAIYGGVLEFLGEQ